MEIGDLSDVWSRPFEFDCQVPVYITGNDVFARTAVIVFPFLAKQLLVKIMAVLANYDPGRVSAAAVFGLRYTPRQG